MKLIHSIHSFKQMYSSPFLVQITGLHAKDMEVDRTNPVLTFWSSQSSRDDRSRSGDDGDTQVLRSSRFSSGNAGWGQPIGQGGEWERHRRGPLRKQSWSWPQNRLARTRVGDHLAEDLLETVGSACERSLSWSAFSQKYKASHKCKPRV